MSRPVLIVRESLVAGPLVAMLVAAPIALVDSPQRWLEMVGFLIAPMVLFVAAARLARRLLAELLPGSRRALFVGLTLWIALSFPVHAALGLVLKATTHHRALGGATFAALALGANLGAALLAWRLSVTLARRGGTVAGMLNVCLAVAMVAVAVLGAPAALAASAGWLLGGVMAVVATVLAARWDIPQKPQVDPPEPI